MSALEVVTVKVVVTGHFAAGKTTLISAISEIPVLATETSVSDESAETKDHTTVTMDFGKLTVKDDDLLAELYMFGTAGHPELRQRLDEILRLDDAATVIPCEATDKESAKEVLLALLIKVLSGLADDAEIPVG